MFAWLLRFRTYLLKLYFIKCNGIRFVCLRGIIVLCSLIIDNYFLWLTFSYIISVVIMVSYILYI